MGAERAGDLLGEGGIAHEGGSHGDALDAEREQPLERGKRAHAAARIHADALDAADRGDGGGVGRLGCGILLERRREVDDVDPGGTAGAELLGDGHGIVGIDLHPRTVAALEAHDLAGDQIDGGEDDHAPPPWTRRTKFSRMRSPTVEDFSGWNCTANRLPPFQIALGKARV